MAFGQTCYISGIHETIVVRREQLGHLGELIATRNSTLALNGWGFKLHKQQEIKVYFVPIRNVPKNVHSVKQGGKVETKFLLHTTNSQSLLYYYKPWAFQDDSHMFTALTGFEDSRLCKLCSRRFHTQRFSFGTCQAMILIMKKRYLANFEARRQTPRGEEHLQ